MAVLMAAVVVVSVCWLRKGAAGQVELFFYILHTRYRQYTALHA
jgi:hypothetical protein